MNYTSNYLLKQWDASDPIRRTDFNEDNAAIDSALVLLSQKVNQIQRDLEFCGNCHVVVGSYVGNGLAGKEYPTSLTFDSKPLMVFIQPGNRSNYTDMKMRMIRGVTYAVACEGNNNYNQTVTWHEYGLEWYSAYETPGTQFNTEGSTYFYVAFLDANEA